MITVSNNNIMQTPSTTTGAGSLQNHLGGVTNVLTNGSFLQNILIEPSIIGNELLDALLAVHNQPKIKQPIIITNSSRGCNVAAREVADPEKRMVGTSVKYSDEKRSLNTFEKLSLYPNPSLAIRYPKPYAYSASRYDSSIHDVIYANMNAIVPNIDIGYHSKTFTPTKLREWIKSTRTYYSEINNMFQKKCDDQLAKLNRIEDQKKRCNNFDITKIDKLPESIVLYIRQYLLPESRIDELLATYPNYMGTLQKMSVNTLRKLYMSGIYNPYYIQFFSNIQNRDRIKCIQPRLELKTGFKNRAHCSGEIKRVFDAYRNAIPHTPEDHIYFQKKALKILQAIVYIAYHRKK